MLKNTSRDEELVILRNKVNVSNEADKEKILNYEQKINNKKQKLTLKYQDQLTRQKNTLSKGKETEQLWYHKKLDNYDKKLLALENSDLPKYKIDNIKIKIDHKKRRLLNEHQEVLTKLQNKYDQKIAEIGKKYNNNIEDLDWELKNYINSVHKVNEDFYTNAAYKINKKYDKELYNSYLSQEAAKLKAKLELSNTKIQKKQINYELSQLPMKVVSENNLIYEPWKVKLVKHYEDFKTNFSNSVREYTTKIRNIKYLTFKDVLNFKLFGIPLFLFVVLAAITIAAVYTKSLPKEAMGAMALLFVIAIIGGEFFNRLPIWKTYIGGGTMGVLFVGAILGTYGLIPRSIIDSTDQWFSKGGFLNLYINILIVGSIITIPRKLILYSFTGLMALIAIGSGLAVLVAIGFGHLMNLPSDKVVLQVILPLLSNGNGGGVQPLSAMSASYGYMPQSDYMSFALAVSGVSNIIVIIFAAILAGSLSKKPALNGNGKLVKKEVHIRDEKVDPSHRSIAAGLIVCIVIYVLCKFLETEIKRLTGVTINAFAWAVAIALIINLTKVLPKDIMDGCSVLNKFFSKQFTWFLMAGVGLVMTDLHKFISLFTQWQYMLIIILMDIALVIGPWLFANLIKFYVLESIIAAGCCMGAQGGAGSLAVIGAAKRLELMPYSQITCRVGGGLVLVVATPLFIMYTR